MSLDIKMGSTHSCSVLSLNEVVEGSKRDKSLFLTIHTSEFSLYPGPEVDRPNAVSFMDSHETANHLFECRRRDAKVILLLSALLSATIATFLSCTYLVAKPNLQDVVVFDLSKVSLLLANLIGITIFPSATPSKPWVVSIPMLIYALWVTSLVISLGCATFAVLLQRRGLRYLPMGRPPHSPRGVSIYTTQEQSLIVLEALFRGLRASLLMSNFLFLWGLGIQLFSAANPPSVLIVFGLSLLRYRIAGVICESFAIEIRLLYTSYSFITSMVQNLGLEFVTVEIHSVTANLGFGHMSDHLCC